MKADVFPADLPSWLPEAIAQCIRVKVTEFERGYEEACRKNNIFDDEAADISNLAANVLRDHLTTLPLVCDPRMESVWWELSRQRPSGAFLYPACVSSGANGQERQDAAMLELFNVAFACRKRREATTTRREIEQQRDYYMVKADELRTDAWILLGQPSYNKERCEKLYAAAQVYEDYARELYATSSGTALERKHDGRARWVALTISDKFRELFNSPMYGLTATITSVVLDRRVDPRTVRLWVGYPAVKTPKIAP
jgi:hypothetical protein